jgi:hypothetical protein
VVSLAIQTPGSANVGENYHRPTLLECVQDLPQYHQAKALTLILKRGVWLQTAGSEDAEDAEDAEDIRSVSAGLLTFAGNLR